MSNITLYHYLSSKKYESMLEGGMLMPSAPFNSNVSEAQWEDYSHQFSFPVARLYTCCFLEPEPQSYRDYGLFELLMEEFSGGDHLLRLNISDEVETPLLIRDHSFHSPQKYEKSVQEWRRREIRNSRPELRQAWYQSTIPLRNYDGNFICPEVLIPFPIKISNIQIMR